MGIVQPDFYDIIKDPGAKAVLSLSPFRLAYDLALIQSAWAMKQCGPSYMVSFICDEDQEHASVVGPDYLKLKEATEYMLSFTTQDEKECEPLQAADAAAFEVRRALNISLKQWPGQLRKQFNVLADTHAMFLIRHTTREQLEWIVANHKPGEPFKLDSLMEFQPPDENIKL